MSLLTPNLDNLRFQSDLVDEARKRIIRYCPEWTDYNVSDPGITLIELFAWMTELLAYRLNQVPEKNYLSFLNLLGFQRRPASSARTVMTYWLSVPLPIEPDNLQDVIVPAGFEVRTDSGESEEIVFSTDRQLNITPPILSFLLKEGQLNRNYLPRLGLETFYPFNQQQPRIGDTFYLGFDHEKDLSGHILRLNFTTEPTEAVGIRREDPPWIWECSLGDGQWHEVQLSTFRDEKDTTGGLNNPDGSLVLYLPLEARPDLVHGREAFWVRCRLEQRQPSQGMYAESPRVLSIQATTLGAAVPASHAQVVELEFIGRGSGEPGQQFNLEHFPVLDLQDGETLLVEEFQNGEYVLVPWQYVTDFSNTTRHDRHFTLDLSSGLIQLGPAVRQADGTFKQYGRVVETDRSVYFQRYRFGGGAQGNLPPNTLQTVASSVAYVARVTNLVRAIGGKDQEGIEEVKLRAQRELQAQKRVVTAQDYEQFVKRYSQSVARVKCLTPGSGMDRKETGVISLLIVPAVAPALQAGDLQSLKLNNEFISGLQKYLDQYRILTTVVKITEPEYVGVQTKVKLVISDYTNPETVIANANRALRNMINPLVPYPEQEKHLPLLEDGWQGWPLGRSLFTAEVSAMLQHIPGVKYVLDVELAHRPVNPAQEGGEESLLPPLVELNDKALWVSQDTVLCSLGHEITCEKLSEFESRND